jgi:type IV pilus assembly protein PilQ
VVLLVLGAACAQLKPAQAPERAAVEGESGASATAAGAWLEVRDVRVEPAGAGRRLTIALSREPDTVQQFALVTPPRLVIDLTGPRADNPASVASFPLGDDLVSQMRVGTQGGRLRAIIDLSRDPGAHAVRREGASLIVELGDTSRAGTSPQAPEAAVLAATEPAGSPAKVEGGTGALGAAAEPAAAEDAGWLEVRDVRIEPVGAGRRLTISLSRAPDALRDFVLASPPRLVIDLSGRPRQEARVARFQLADDLVARVRAASNGAVLRVVVDFRDKAAPHVLRQEGVRLIADLGGADLSSASPSSEDLALVPAPDGPGDGTLERVVYVEEAPAAPGEPAPTLAEAPAPPAAPAAAPPAAAAPDPAPPAAAPPSETVARVTPAKAGRPARQPASEVAFTGQRISLDFKDADIQNVLRVLADVSGLNIIATEDVRGKVTLHLSDVPWDQALDLVLRSNRLEKMQEGNVVRISTVARLKEEREALRAAQDAERELEPLHVKYVKVNYARADEVLIDKVKGVLTDRGSVTFDDRTNTVIVRDIPRGTADATELIRELDVQSPQVLIEANIVEATEDFARGLGVQWGYRYNAGPQTGNPTGSNFPGTVGIGGSGVGFGVPPPSAVGGVPPTPVPFIADFPVPANFASGFGPGAGSALDIALGSIDGTSTLSARLTALEEQGKGRVISRPRVITMNNVAATIQSLTILRVKLPSTGTVINTGTGGAAGTATTATEKINTGITLVVTPQISADGYVLMSIYAKSSLPDFTRTVDGIPNEISREANSNVLIKNGETVVLGGIYRQTSDDREAGLPYLRRIPALGWLFKRVLEARRREELLVFLTPKIVASTAGLPDAQRLWEERRQGG